MEDKHIHDGLVDAELRNSISDGLNDAISSSHSTENPKYPYSGSLVEKMIHSITVLKNDIKDKEEEIKNIERMISLLTLMEYKGWSEFDVSDYVVTNNKVFRSFIGTEEEYNKFINKIKK